MLAHRSSRSKQSRIKLPPKWWKKRHSSGSNNNNNTNNAMIRAVGIGLGALLTWRGRKAKVEVEVDPTVLFQDR